MDYHNVLSDCAPVSGSRKQIMMDWLDKHYILYCQDVLEPQLYELIKQHKQQLTMLYRIDDLLRSYGHTVLCLLLYHMSNMSSCKILTSH